MLLKRTARFLAGLVVALGAAPSRAQVPVGPEFVVSESSVSGYVSVAAGPAADFAVAWEDYGPVDLDPMARRYNAKGLAVGPAFTTTLGTGDQFHPAVASDGGSRFVVAWIDGAVSNHEEPSIKGRRFDSLGRALGPEFQLDSGFTTRAFSGPPQVSMAPDGRFVAVWPTRTSPSTVGVAARRCNARECLGPEFDVNAFTTGFPAEPDVAVHADGSFVVAWRVIRDGGGSGVFARLFDATGAARGVEFQVNTDTTGGQVVVRPRVTPARDGSFVVAWNGLHQDGSIVAPFARRFDASGAPLGGEFRASTMTTGVQILGDVTADETGNFVVSWSEACGYAPGCGVFGQRFAASGERRGPAFRVDEGTSRDDGYPSSVTADPAGNFIVAWSAGYGAVLGRRYGGTRPMALGVDAAGNGVLEPGETVDVRPSWSNAGASPVSVDGTLTEIGGPPGATYTITDAAGRYGTLPSGSQSACSDCYAVSVSDPAVRPAAHWDAAAVEALEPEALGVNKRWRLHVGHSFTDVPASSPYYRFVETMLHRGVSTGCGPGAYCPAAATSREQMAVFALSGKEGTGFLPPRCGTVPAFADVPPTSPFCPWVEELARRGVVAGCGGGDYCPAAAVTREQMAIFVLRTLDPSLRPPACGPTTLYADVPASSPFCAWIEELTRRGVVGGCGDGNYCPGAPVTRDQMAAFIGGTFGLTLYGP